MFHLHSAHFPVTTMLFTVLLIGVIIIVGALTFFPLSLGPIHGIAHRCTRSSGSTGLLWLWFTVLFANFAEAMAEGRGKAQADTLRKARSDTIANRHATAR